MLFGHDLFGYSYWLYLDKKLNLVCSALAAAHFLDHPDWMSKVKIAVEDLNTEITVNLEGFSGGSTYSKVMGAAQRGMTNAAKYTEWEISQIYKAGRLGSVNFVNRLGEVILNPFK